MVSCCSEESARKQEEEEEETQGIEKRKSKRKGEYKAERTWENGEAKVANIEVLQERLQFGTMFNDQIGRGHQQKRHYKAVVVLQQGKKQAG
jgi:hypothetical protein